MIHNVEKIDPTQSGENLDSNNPPKNNTLSEKSNILSLCPFCGGEAEFLERITKVDCGDIIYNTYYFVKCKVCGACGTKIYRKPLCDFTKHTVADFRENPALRARVEDEYEVFVESLKNQAAEAWEKRVSQVLSDVIEIECDACKGTGVYVGFAEREGAGVVCNRCNGTGKIDFKYTKFTGRKKRDDVKRVYISGYGYVISTKDVVMQNGRVMNGSEGGCTYEDWWNGTGDPWNPITGLYCPYIWKNTGIGNEPLERCKEGCNLGSRISNCKFFEQKEECWKEYFDKINLIEEKENE